MIDLDAAEIAQQILIHSGGEISELIPMIHDLGPVADAMRAANDRLQGRTPDHDVVSILIPSFLESDLYRVIEDLDLRQSNGDRVTPGQLYQRLLGVISKRMEGVLWDVYELLAHSQERWVLEILKGYDYNE